MMKINEFIKDGKFFSYMPVSQLNTIGDQLDILMLDLYGQRTCSYMITNLTVDGVVSESDREQLANRIYLLNKNEWDKLFAFVEANLDPWVDSNETTTVKYGKVVDDENGGKDEYGQTDKIAGFDSSDFVNKDSVEHNTTYGKTVKSTNSGEDVTVKEGRSSQAERLVNYTLSFWDKYGITKKVIQDTIKYIALAIYESED